MLKYLLALICLPIIVYGAENPLPVLIFDAHPPDHSLKQFRRHPWLSASASGQFNSCQIDTIKKLAKDVVIVDLRQEPHGFINDLAVSWNFEQNNINLHKHITNDFYLVEQQYLATLQLHSNINIFKPQKIGQGKIIANEYITLQITAIESEKILVEKLNLMYKRFYILDHNPPSPQQIAEFITWLQEINEKNYWLHFHCRAGKGRSSTFLAIYDILLTGKQEPLNKILKRQVEIGSIDLQKTLLAEHKKWKQDYAQQRYLMLQDLYNYTRLAYPEISYLDWHNIHVLSRDY